MDSCLPRLIHETTQLRLLQELFNSFSRPFIHSMNPLHFRWRYTGYLIDSFIHTGIIHEHDCINSSVHLLSSSSSSYVHSFIHLLHSFLHSFIHSFIYSINHSFVRSYVFYAFIQSHSSVHSLHSFTGSFIFFIHPFTKSHSSMHVLNDHPSIHTPIHDPPNHPSIRQFVQHIINSLACRNTLHYSDI